MFAFYNPVQGDRKMHQVTLYLPNGELKNYSNITGAPRVDPGSGIIEFFDQPDSNTRPLRIRTSLPFLETEEVEETRQGQY
jgi:hypothetical protein